MRGFEVYLPFLTYPLAFGLSFICELSLDLGLDCLLYCFEFESGVCERLLSVLGLLFLLTDLLLFWFL